MSPLYLAAIGAELDSLDPPKQVRIAATTCLNNIAAGLNPPRDLMSYVTSWVAREQTQNRYGK